MLSVFRRNHSRRKALRVARMLAELDGRPGDRRARPAARRAERLSLARV